MQHYRPAKHADRHDVQLLPNHLRALGHRVEVLADQAVDLVLRDWLHRPPALQHHPHAQESVQAAGLPEGGHQGRQGQGEGGRHQAVQRRHEVYHPEVQYCYV